MKPFITKVDISHYSRGWLKKICSCNKKCTTGVTVTIHDEGFTMCEGEAKKTMFELVGVLGMNNGAEWTEADEQFIIQHYEEKGMYKGFNNYIATTLNKTYYQAKNKTQNMQRAGKLNGTGTYKSYHKWTDEETEYLINHIKEKGVYKGYKKEIAKELGLTEGQVIHRIDYLKAKDQL